MKLISFTIPCYNSEAYMGHAIETVLSGGDEVEIIIVNDGSSDDTQRIAEYYAARYPEMIRVINQENGGHGAAVNAGLKVATGKYFKVVDSDDWVDEAALQEVLATLRYLEENKESIDMLIANYVYEKVGVKKKNVVCYGNALPEKQVFSWDDLRHFHLDQYILMHSVIYRTTLLKEIGLQLPRHTFYVDNIYVYYPLPKVKKMYYLNVDFYRYFIGRDDQSVNEQMMIKRANQQIFITKELINQYRLSEIQNSKLRNYMTKYLAIMMTVSSIVLIRSHTKEALQQKADLWQYLKEKDAPTYKKIRHGILGQAMNLPGKLGRKTSEFFYVVAKNLIGFQ